MSDLDAIRYYCIHYTQTPCTDDGCAPCRAADEIEQLTHQIHYWQKSDGHKQKDNLRLLEENRALRERLEKVTAALRAIDICESQFSTDPLKRAVYAVEHCQETAREALCALDAGEGSR